MSKGWHGISVAGNVRNTLCRVKKVRYTLARNLISATAVIVRTPRGRVDHTRKLCNGLRYMGTRRTSLQPDELSYQKCMKALFFVLNYNSIQSRRKREKERSIFIIIMMTMTTKLIIIVSSVRMHFNAAAFRAKAPLFNVFIALDDDRVVRPQCSLSSIYILWKKSEKGGSVYNVFISWRLATLHVICSSRRRRKRKGSWKFKNTRVSSSYMSFL